jgi:hypothetical protein
MDLNMATFETQAGATLQDRIVLMAEALITAVRRSLGLPIETRVEVPATPVEDDPAILARLSAIMEDRVHSCPTCGGDTNTCRVIGHDPEGIQARLASGELSPDEVPLEAVPAALGERKVA